MDSLLSVDDLPHESRVPTLPPKTKFVSTGNLLPPALPPKQRNMKKRVAISTDEVRIIGIGGYSSDDYNDAETFKSMSRQIHPSNYCPPPIEPPAPQPGKVEHQGLYNMITQTDISRLYLVFLRSL